jgi:MFS family permease
VSVGNPDKEPARVISEGYKRYVLATLTLVFTLNLADRSLLALLLQPIKEDLRVSDTQLGFLTGIAFGIFYATLGLPIARWADRGNRTTITSLAIALWGMTVMSCLFVGNFVHLLLARIGAGVGEAGCMPPTYSLIGDYFPEPKERTGAMTIYWLAAPLCSLVSFVVGGRLYEVYGWRMTFFLVGIPGLLLAALVKTTVVEPRIRKSIRGEGPARELPTTARVLAILWNQRSSRHLSIATILLFTMMLGLGPWYAAFMMRSHGMTTGELGVWLGLIFSVSGIVGVLLGGYVMQRWFAGNERGQVRLTAIAIITVVPCLFLFLFLPHKQQVLIVMVPLITLASFFFGPTFALMQRLVVDEIRATALAAVMLLANLIGMGVGPQAVGLISDCLGPLLKSDSLRYAMLTMSFAALWAAYHFWQVGRTVKEDLIAVGGCVESSPSQAGLST